MNTRDRVPAAPVDIPGTALATWRHTGQVTFLLVRGYFYGATRSWSKGRRRAAIRSGLFAVLGTIMSPLLIAIYAVMISSPRSRYYLDAERTAVLAVAATRRSWLIQDHASARPGDGAGRTLREKLLPTILSTADRHRIPIVLETSVPELEDAYQRDIPGLRRVGDGRLGRKTYRRDPGSSPGTGE